jgi:hypothetical protein
VEQTLVKLKYLRIKSIPFAKKLTLAISVFCLNNGILGNNHRKKFINASEILPDCWKNPPTKRAATFLEEMTCVIFLKLNLINIILSYKCVT